MTMKVDPSTLSSLDKNSEFPTPEEVLKTRLTLLRPKIEALRAHVIEKLKSGYNGNNGVTVNRGSYEQPVWDVIVNEAKSAGWSVDYFSDVRTDCCGWKFQGKN